MNKSNYFTICTTYVIVLRGSEYRTCSTIQYNCIPGELLFTVDGILLPSQCEIWIIAILYFVLNGIFSPTYMAFRQLLGQHLYESYLLSVFLLLLSSAETVDGRWRSLQFANFCQINAYSTETFFLNSIV